MKNNSDNRSFVRSATWCAAALLACALPGAWAQERQKLSYTATAADTKYTKREMLEIGDAAGHTVGIFEIHRTFSSNPPTINGVKVKESWTRGYSDYVSKTNGLSTNYTTFVLEDGDKFFTVARTMGQADGSGRRSTTSVGEVIGGTGKLAAMKGVVRSNGLSDGAKGFNETKSEIEYWFTK